MGYRYQQDGLCYVCEVQTEYYCDHCMKYVCGEHRKDVEIAASPQLNLSKHFIFCDECHKKGKTKAIDPYRHIRNPEHT